MSLLMQQLKARPVPWGAATLLLRLFREWDVRRQMARAQMLDGASLRDIGVAGGGLESAIRHGREH